MKINRIRSSMTVTLFFIEMSITAISFYWRNDTPSFVTWRSRLATALDTPTCIVIYGGQFTGRVNISVEFLWLCTLFTTTTQMQCLNARLQFVPEIVSPLPCPPALIRHTLLFVYFFKELISFIGSLDKSHTSVFNALIESHLIR